MVEGNEGKGMKKTLKGILPNHPTLSQRLGYSDLTEVKQKASLSFE